MLRTILFSLFLIQSCRTTFVDPDLVDAPPTLKEEPPILVVASWDSYYDESHDNHEPESTNEEDLAEVIEPREMDIVQTSVQPVTSSVKLDTTQEHELVAIPTFEEAPVGQEGTAIIVGALILLALCVILAPAK